MRLQESGEMYLESILMVINEKGNCYEAKSLLRDGHVLRGIYYKEDDIPVSFINSMRID